MVWNWHRVTVLPVSADWNFLPQGIFSGSLSTCCEFNKLKKFKAQVDLNSRLQLQLHRILWGCGWWTLGPVWGSGCMLPCKKILINNLIINTLAACQHSMVNGSWFQVGSEDVADSAADSWCLFTWAGPHPSKVMGQGALRIVRPGWQSHQEQGGLSLATWREGAAGGC